MKLPSPTVQLEIALPFTLLFVAAGLMVAPISISPISRALEGASRARSRRSRR